MKKYLSYIVLLWLSCSVMIAKPIDKQKALQSQSLFLFMIQLSIVNCQLSISRLWSVVFDEECGTSTRCLITDNHRNLHGWHRWNLVIFRRNEVVDVA